MHLLKQSTHTETPWSHFGIRRGAGGAAITPGTSGHWQVLAAVKNRLNLAENPIMGSHRRKRACAMQALCHG